MWPFSLVEKRVTLRPVTGIRVPARTWSLTCSPEEDARGLADHNGFPTSVNNWFDVVFSGENVTSVIVPGRTVSSAIRNNILRSECRRARFVFLCDTLKTHCTHGSQPCRLFLRARNNNVQLVQIVLAFVQNIPSAPVHGSFAPARNCAPRRRHRTNTLTRSVRRRANENVVGLVGNGFQNLSPRFNFQTVLEPLSVLTRTCFQTYVVILSVW